MAMRLCVYPNLAAEMARCNDTQKTLADALGVSQSSLCLKMSGRRGFTMHEIDSACRRYDKSYEELFREGK